MVHIAKNVWIAAHKQTHRAQSTILDGNLYIHTPLMSDQMNKLYMHE